jgi:hypothetical protein
MFVIRLWQEKLANEPGAWRGEIKYVGTGEVRYFSTWESLVTLIPIMLENDDGQPGVSR